MTKAKTPPAKKPGAKKAPKNGNGRIEAAQRERLFIEAMIATGGNKTESAIRAGFSKKTASQMGLKVAKRPSVVAALRERQDALAEKHELTTESVLAELSKIVHADPRKLFNEDGSMKAPHEWPDGMAGAIASVEVYEEFDDVEVEEDLEPQANGGALKRATKQRKLVGYTKKLKLWDKNSAIDKAMKHLGLFEKDNEQKAGALAGLPPEILKAIVARLKELKGARPRLAG